MNSDNKENESEKCPFFGSTLFSNKQIRVSLNGSQQMIPSNDSISLTINEKSVKYTDIVTGENFEFEWEQEKYEASNWHFRDNHNNFWIVSATIITWILTNSQLNISFMLNTQNNVVQKIMDARFKELTLTKGNTNTEPLYALWKCPSCKKENMSLIGIKLNQDMTLNGMAEKLANSPLTFLEKIPYCNCTGTQQQRMQLTFSMFCVYNTKNNFDLQIHNSYDSAFTEKDIELYMVDINGKAQKFSIEDRIKFIGF